MDFFLEGDWNLFINTRTHKDLLPFLLGADELCLDFFFLGVEFSIFWIFTEVENVSSF